MRIARPPTGFVITLAPAVSAMIEARISDDPEFASYWADVLERLRMTAHREGEQDVRLGSDYRLWRRTAEPGRAGLRLVYRVLGDEVVIKVAALD